MICCPGGGPCTSMGGDYCDAKNCVHSWLDKSFGLRHLCEPCVVILLNWTPLFGVVYGNVGVKDRHRKETCIMMRLDYVLKLYQHKENRSFNAISC